MKHRVHFIYSLFVILCFTAASCKEVKVYPTIFIEEPAEGSSYTFGDTIYVSATVENATENVRIDILKGSSVIKIGSELHEKEGDFYRWRLFYDEKYLQGGTYDIRVSGSNNGNNNSDFRKIALNPYPFDFRGLSFLTNASQGNIIGRIDSVGGVLTINSDDIFNFLANRSEFRQVIAAPESEGDLIGHKFTNLNPDFVKPDLRLQDNRQYNQFYVFDRMAYGLLNDGRIFRIGENGSTELILTLDELYIPIMAEMSDRGLFVGVKEGTLNSYRLLLLNPQSGAILRQVHLPARPQGISYAGENRCFVTYFRNGNGIVAEYELTANLLMEKLTISGETPNDILVANGFGYVGTQNSLYSFQANQPVIIQELINLPAAQLEYEEVNNEVYFSSGPSIFKFSIGGNQQQYVHFASDVIIDFDLMYNK